MPKAEGTSNALPAPRTLRGIVEAVVSTAAHLELGSAPSSGVGDRGLAITNFQPMELMKSVAARAPQPSRRGDLLPRNLGD